MRQPYSQPYNAFQVSQLLNIAPSTVTQWISAGKLSATKVGRKYLIFDCDLIKLIGEDQFESVCKSRMKVEQ